MVGWPPDSFLLARARPEIHCGLTVSSMPTQVVSDYHWHRCTGVGRIHPGLPADACVDATRGKAAQHERKNARVWCKLEDCVVKVFTQVPRTL